MSDLLEKHPFRDQLVELFQRGASLREISRMIGGSKSTIARLRDEWQRERPSVPQQSKAYVQGQARAREMRERIESLLDSAQARGDLKASVALLARLDSLDRRILSPTSRRQEQTEKVQVIFTTADGQPYPADSYIQWAARELGWKATLKAVLEVMALSNVSAEIIAGMGKFICTIEEVENGVVAESNPSDSRERA